MFLSEFYENGNQGLPGTTSDWEICCWSWCKDSFWEKSVEICRYLYLMGMFKGFPIIREGSMIWSGDWRGAFRYSLCLVNTACVRIYYGVSTSLNGVSTLTCCCQGLSFWSLTKTIVLYFCKKSAIHCNSVIEQNIKFPSS